MPPPANNSAATATVIAALPYDTVQPLIHDAGTTYDVWYTLVATFTGVLGLWGYGGGSAYTPACIAWTGPNSGALSLWPPGGHGFAEDRPLQVPVVNGEQYWFQFQANFGDPNPATLTLDVQAAPNELTVAGDLLVNDDSAGFPAAILNPDTGDLRRFLYPFPNGEAGDILAGFDVLLIEDFDAGNLKVYDADFALINTLAQPSGSPRIRAQRTLNRFYVGLQENPVEVVTVENDGEYGVDSWTLTGITSILALAANNDGTILYHSDNSASQPLRRYDLVGNAPLSNLAALETGYLIPDILVMSDDTVIALYVHPVFGTMEIRHYAPNGTLLDTFTQADTALPAGTLPRLAYSGTPGNFWVWRHTLDPEPEGFSHFREIRVSDGATVREFTRIEFETGVMNTDPTGSPEDRFGISFSCPFLQLGLAAAVPGSPSPSPSSPGELPEGEIGPIAWVEEWGDGA